MIKLIELLGAWLTPPEHATDDQLSSWRDRAAGIMAINAFATAYLTVWLAGVVPWHNGFVKYDDFVEVRAGQLREEIKQNARIICMYQGIPGAGNGAAVEYASDQIDRLRQEYRERTGGDYTPPPCGVLVIVEG